MKWPSLAAGMSCGFAIFLIQLCGAIPGPRFALLAAVTAGVLGVVLSAKLQVGAGWTPVWLVAACSAAAILLSFQNKADALLWLAPLVASFAAAVLVLYKRKTQARHCALCRRTARALLFICPRCSQPVCDSDDCWNYDHCRCQQCEDNRVPILRQDAAWWTTQFGAVLSQGRCLLCLTDVVRADLFACPRCGRPQCRRCWDYANGQCTACRWLIPELPERLRAYMKSGG
jgi:hypothetical protein